MLSPTAINRVLQPQNVLVDQTNPDGHLPIGPVTDNVFKYLSPLDLVRFSRTSRQGYVAITDYGKHAFSITNLLGRYFSPTDVLGFRFLQAQTRTVISGSSALQFFERVYYPESDLDIYVEARRVEPVAEWLTYAGYELLPDPLEGQVASLDERLLKLDKKMREHCPGMFKQSLVEEEGTYLGRCMVKVYNYYRKIDPTKRIQLILTYNSPLELILAFHSTCVMNIITHDTAYALFPYATFEQKVTLVIEKSRDERCLEKYRTRGWKVLNQVPQAEAYDPRSDFYAPSRVEGIGAVRYVGDKRCWTIPLSPEMGTEKPEFTKYLNSWQLIHSAYTSNRGYPTSDVKFKILRSRMLENSYTVALKPAIFLEPILLALEDHIGQKLDHDVENLLRNYFESFNGPE
ncbi:hypothetical protein BDN72DRAFT_803392 [Pluteus cervinus]|uniref:Uncharacterized protein n=1 Tax=Pluteus cervinus TaxID=181527 RepID=A0ACD3ACG0_9AGAR|nr:hypothetical protein BDN72DRAFT_803392 [Pluteus cervinus]